MEHKVRTIDPEELMPQLPQLLQQAQAVPLIISGNSMAPFWPTVGIRCICRS